MGAVEPGGQKYPGSAMHAPEHADVVRRVAFPNTPAGQGVHCDEPTVEYVPRGHSPEHVAVARLVALPKTPAGHSEQVVLVVAYEATGQGRHSTEPVVFA